MWHLHFYRSRYQCREAMRRRCMWEMAFCVLGALILGGWYGGLAGAVGMTIADLMDPVYITGAPKTFVLKLCIGLIVGLVAHRIAKINESTDGNMYCAGA